MNAAGNIVDFPKASGAARIQPLRIISPSIWHGKDIPEREWLVPGMLVRGGVTILNGDGGIGKSLLTQQLLTAAALGEPWLGLETPRDGIASIGFFCEDDEDELWRRQADICAHYRVGLDELADRVQLISRVGEEFNLLMRFPRQVAERTHLYQQLETAVMASGARILAIDTASDTFGGDEIRRDQVRAYITSLRGLAIKMKGTVVLTQHPSQQGRLGSGESGSTAWNNSVRNRVYFTRPKKEKEEEREEEQTDERVLKVMKSNYGPAGSKIRLLWKSGVFVLAEGSAPSLFNTLDLRGKLIDVCRDMVQGGTLVAADCFAKNGLVSAFRNQPGMDSHKAATVYAQQIALVKDGKLCVVNVRKPDRKMVQCIRPSWLAYPGEMGRETE